MADDDLIQAAKRLSRYDWQDWTAQDIEDAESIVRAFRRIAAPPAQGVQSEAIKDALASLDMARDRLIAALAAIGEGRVVPGLQDAAERTKGMLVEQTPAPQGRGDG